MSSALSAAARCGEQSSDRGARTGTARTGASARSSRRDAALDLLRTIALVRVVLWHLFADSWMTWIAAMPVMFFVAGSLLPLRAGDAGGRRSFLVRRLRRILVPLWVYGASVAVAHALFTRATALSTSTVGRVLTWIVPVIDPRSSGWDGGWLTNHLWYLRAYVWILVLAPVLVWASSTAKRLRGVLVATAVVVVGLEVARHAAVPVLGSGTVRMLLGDTVAYGLFVVLGLAWRRHGTPGTPRRLAATALLLSAAAVAFAELNGLPSEGVTGSYPAIVLVGAAWLAAVGALEARLRAIAERPFVQRATRAVSSRALTMYLWHPACIVLARRYLPSRGVIGALTLSAGTVVLVAVVIALVGAVESLAANGLGGRNDRPALHPVLRPMLGAVGATALIGGAVPVLSVTIAASPAQSAAAHRLAFGIPAPSARDALSDSAFSGAAPTTTPAVQAATSNAAALALVAPSATAPATTAPATTAPTTTATTSTTTVPATTAPGTTAPIRHLTAATPITPAPTTSPRTTTKAAGKSAKTTTLKTTTTKPAATRTTTKATTTTAAAPATPTTPPTTPPSTAATTTTPAATLTTAKSTPTTTKAAASTAVALPPAQVLQKALDDWRASASPKIDTMVVAVRSGSQTWVARSADGAMTSKYSTDKAFLTASLTKTFTAALVLREVEKGTISLDDPAPSIPGLTVKMPAGITVRRLLTHTAGLGDYTAAKGYKLDQALTPIDAVNLAFAMPLLDGLGTTVRYNNAGYLYLGLLLEQVTGSTYPSLVAGLAADAGLQSTTVDTTLRPGWIGFSSGGVTATASDLATWAQALFTPGKILSAKGVSMLTTLGDMNLGLGTWPACPCWTDANGVKRYTAIGHNTADGAMFWFPATGMTIVAMFEPKTNDVVGLMDALVAAIKAYS